MIRVLQGDVRAVLPTLASGSVHCICTSPPYYGLRDYGTAQWEGGDPACSHKPNTRNGSGRADGIIDERGQRNRDGIAGLAKAMVCKCGAKRVDLQIGMEPTPDAYVETMVGVFREARRVLHESGTVFLNVGDSYGGPAGNNRSGFANPKDGGGKNLFTGRKQNQNTRPKDLCMIPWRLALALQADGWWLRSIICWHKRAPMPESVTDRPTSSWEPIFLLAKSERYFYDAEAVKEPAEVGANGSTFTGGKTGVNGLGRVGQGEREDAATRNLRNVWSLSEPLATLRADLTDEQRLYVVTELVKRGLL